MSINGRGFIGYPTNRVVGTVGDASKAKAAIDGLLRAGFNEECIDILHGEEDLHRLDPNGTEHGFLTQFHRTMIRSFDLEEFKHLSHHVDDVRAGRYVVMVLTKRREHRIVAGDILHQHGAEFVGFYGRWAWADVPPSHHMTPSDVAPRFASAWNARNLDALASLFDGDAQFVNLAGQWWHGRDEIRQGFAARLESLPASSTLSAGETNVKLLLPEVALVHAHMTLSNDAGEPARETVISFVVHRVGERWLCASAHNTEIAASARPAASAVASA